MICTDGMGAILVEYWPCCHQLSHWDLARVDQPGHYRAQDSSKRCSECQWETWTKWNLFMRKRNEVFRYTPSKETIWVKQAALRLVDRLARDIPQPARKEGYMLFHFFSSKTPVMCYAVRMANFNFLAQPINITILFSLRFSRQNKSSSSTWCQLLLSLNGMVVRVNANFEKRGVVWIESWLWMVCEEDVCWVVGIPRTCSFWHVLACRSRNGVFGESLL